MDARTLKEASSVTASAAELERVSSRTPVHTRGGSSMFNKMGNSLGRDEVYLAGCEPRMGTVLG